MDFATAVRTCLSEYAGFSGRARRSQFWYFTLFCFLAGIVTSVVDEVLGTDHGTGSGGLVNTLVSLALLLPSIAVAVRRLHDIGRSGWWILLGLVPIIGWSIVIVWYCTDTKRGPNQYGPDPKHGAALGAYPPPQGAPHGEAPHGGAPHGDVPQGGSPYGGAPQGS